MFFAVFGSFGSLVLKRIMNTRNEKGVAVAGHVADFLFVFGLGYIALSQIKDGAQATGIAGILIGVGTLGWSIIRLWGHRRAKRQPSSPADEN